MVCKTIIQTFLVITVIIGINSCKQKTEDKVEDKAELFSETKEVATFNFDNKKELSKYRELELDRTHPNLLNPEISKTEYKLVRESWTDLHQRIGTYLSERDFNWEIGDPSVDIVHKIYFNPNGEIENYFFNVLNENVSQQKKEEFANLISEFAKNHRIGLNKDERFAQCGKTKYLNK